MRYIKKDKKSRRGSEEKRNPTHVMLSQRIVCDAVHLTFTLWIATGSRDKVLALPKGRQPSE